MKKYLKLLEYAGIAAIVFLLIGLTGWYFFLRGETGNIEALDAARGFDIAVPSFTGSRSSTSENIAGGVGTETLLTTPQEGKPPRLWRVSTSPIAGMNFLTGTSTLRYVERSTGHVYDVYPGSGTIARKTNTLLPKVYDAGIFGDGSFAMRMLHESGARLTLMGELGTTTEDNFSTLESTNLGENVISIAASSERPDAVLVASGANGGEVVRARVGSAPQRLVSLSLSSLKPLLLADGRVFLAERPASGITGSAFEVVSGALTPVLRNLPGLAVLPRPFSGALLYSTDDGSRLRLFVRAAAEASVSELSLATTADKCVWGRATGTTTPLVAYCAAPQSPVPPFFTDFWLRGSVHTMDAWFTIDPAAAKTDAFFTPESSVAIDVERPVMDASGEYIAFMNARDKSLWILRIKE